MIRTGDTIVNSVTGERLTFLKAACDTDGAYTLVECTVEPHGFVASAHVHPFQTERFEVVSGTLGLRAGRVTRSLGPGEAAVVEPGTPHRFWNAGDDRATFRCTVSPALQFESLVETMFGLAEDGKTNRRGMPNPFRLAVIAQAHFDTVRLPRVPAVLQRAALTAGAPFGRLLGYGSEYAPEPAGAYVAA